MAEQQMISRHCNECDRDIPLVVQLEDLEKYNNGAFVQDAFPYLNAGDRELIISGTCSECFDKMFEMFE